MSRCGSCETSVQRKQSVFCSRPCKKCFHAGCVDVPSELPTHLLAVQGLRWYCSICRTIENKFDDKKLQDIFDKRCAALFEDFSVKFESLKTEFLNSALEKISDFPTTSEENNASTTPTFAEKVIHGPKQKIIVKPKNPQETSRTKQDLLTSVNPVDHVIKFEEVRHIKDGGMLFQCSQSAEASKLEKVMHEKLSYNYNVHILKSLHPQIRVVGYTENLDEESLLQYILKQNDTIFGTNSDCKVVRTGATNKNKAILQATLQVDMSSYKKLINQGHILIGFDSCSVFDATHVPRCFKCNSFFHNSKSCRNEICCAHTT
ncbi:unnamed protein product [Phaedon cochleariae]|uniref:Zinc finger PHD-type domain-containing protein n=1 Tax=Phaedon cochleariae TaxID=80249 RepID=A0A9N9X355_PHACE|nr:unnamed protein product [Phaedon cochleariae]